MTMVMLTCLYCEETKPLASFNREHLLPRAFGTYPKDNQVLHDTVCENCNSHFSRELEIPLTRDTWEGIERYAQGLSSIQPGRAVGTTLLEARHRGGVPDGAFLEWRAEGSTYQRVMRAIAKIAFNYFAFPYRGLAFMEQFRPIRSYIRYGKELPIAPIAMSEGSILGGVPEDRQLLVHTVVVAWEPASECIVGRVSLFSWCVYKVLLAPRGTFTIAPTCIGSGHVFDPMNRRILRLTRWDGSGPPHSAWCESS
jgi:hypothetical protein